jgi:hypothetical protein
MAEPLTNPPPTGPTDVGPSTSAAIPPATPAAAANPESVKQLSKEEQMAAFEEDLKYNDWGHQPC